jgi:hypothetical protein
MSSIPGGPGDPIWTAKVGPGNTTYTVQYKGGQDDIRFNFENDNSSIDLPIYLVWGNAAQYLDQAKRDILGYPLVTNGPIAGQYVSRVTPMTALPFLQLTNGRPYLFAVSMSGTGWGLPPENGAIKNPTLNFPIYYQCKATVHFESLTYDIYTDQEMFLLGLIDANGNPDEATLARYVTKEFVPGMEYLALPQGGFTLVATPLTLGLGPSKGPPVPGTAGKLTPNYDLSLTWELVPQSCIGSVLYNPSLQNPPIDLCLGCVNKTPFPPQPTVTEQGLSTVGIVAGGAFYNVGDTLFLLGGLAGSSATVQVDTVGVNGSVAGVTIINPGNYIVNVTLPSPPANPVATATTGEGSGCTLTCGFTNLGLIQLMTAYPSIGGSGYLLGDILTLSGGTFTTPATARVVGLQTPGTGPGAVLVVQILSRGAYSLPPTPNPVDTTGGTGSGCALNCEFGNGIPPGQLLMTAATITPIRSSSGDRLFRLTYRFKYLPQGVQSLYYQGNPKNNYADAGFFETTTTGVVNIGSGLYNTDPTAGPVDIYPWADFATLFRVPS